MQARPVNAFLPPHTLPKLSGGWEWDGAGGEKAEQSPTNHSSSLARRRTWGASELSSLGPVEQDSLTSEAHCPWLKSGLRTLSRVGPQAPPARHCPRRTLSRFGESGEFQPLFREAEILRSWKGKNTQRGSQNLRAGRADLHRTSF